MSARSRSASSGSEVRPAAQKVPYSVPSLNVTLTETKLRMRGSRAAGSRLASGTAATSGITAGSRPSRTAWQKLVSWRWVAPSRNRNGIADSTTSRC